MEFEPDGFWWVTPRELAMRMKGADIRLRREHNDRMTLAFWSSNWVNLKKPPTLKEMLVATDNKPRTKRDWRALKTLLQMALPAKD